MFVLKTCDCMTGRKGQREGGGGGGSGVIYGNN